MKDPFAPKYETINGKRIKVKPVVNSFIKLREKEDAMYTRLFTEILTQLKKEQTRNLDSNERVLINKLKAKYQTLVPFMNSKRAPGDPDFREFLKTPEIEETE